MSSSLSITFVLPGEGTLPAGGPKMVYQYANELAQRGHRVSVVHPAFLQELSGLQSLKRAVRYVTRHLDDSYRPDAWFHVDPRVQLLWKPSLQPKHVPDADVVVATWWMTAEQVAQYPASKGSKFYFIQHLETWGGPEDRVMATWRLPLHKILISKWLQEIADRIGEPSSYIPYGLDFSAFGIDVDPEKRDPHRVMMLYHNENWKGSADGLQALHLAHQQVPRLKVDLFGVPAAPEGLPAWIHYHQNPPQARLRQLYNGAAVFVAPSWTEGWGLPGIEALQSGCSLVATDVDGHREFCIQDQTALLSPAKDPTALAENLLRLMQDKEQRIRLAHSGNKYIQQFTWERATAALLETFFRDIEHV